MADEQGLTDDQLEAVAAGQQGHEPVTTPEGWVDCSCGWESNHVRLPSALEQAQRDAVAAFDAEDVPPCPYKPELHPMVPPSEADVAALHAWNDWQRRYGDRVRPPEPTDSTGEPDRTNDEEWQAHLIAVGRDAAIAKHVEDGGTLKDVPPALALLGVEGVNVE